MPHDALATSSAQPAASSAPQLHHLQPAGLYDATPNGYTHVVTVHGPAQWAFVSGQGGENQAGDLPDSFAAQAQQALSNLKLALQAAGADMGQVVKLTLLIVDHSEARFNDWQAAVRLHWSDGAPGDGARSEEHTSELQSQSNLVCRLLLEKKKNTKIKPVPWCSSYRPRTSTDST